MLIGCNVLHMEAGPLGWIMCRIAVDQDRCMIVIFHVLFMAVSFFLNLLLHFIGEYLVTLLKLMFENGLRVVVVLHGRLSVCDGLWI